MREKILFDDDWMFHLGEIESTLPLDKGPIYTQSKTVRKIWGPASPYYKGSPVDYSQEREVCCDKWEWVSIPHDFIINQRPDKNQNNTLGFFKYENAWYRKTFTVSDEDKNKRITLFFEGIATHATVYLNGCLMKHNFCGYNSFEVDITDVLNFGDKKNVLAIYVETNEHEGWWYEGGGIYRHVWLCKTENVSVDLWGVYVVPKKEENTWNINIETTVRNDNYYDVSAKIKTYLKDKYDNVIAECGSTLNIPLRELNTAKYSVKVDNPKLWDIDDPNLYDVITEIYVDDIKTDEYLTRTGFRTFEINPDTGLFLNGRHVKIKGVCAHQDCGLTGKAVADNVNKYKIEMIKEMGANGYRTSHYPQTESIMDTLDELGFIVMAETRWFESTDEGKAQLEMLVKRDRNRPSVLFWSVGNEEPLHTTEQGRRICKNLMAYLKKLDNSRFVMSAVSNDPDVATVYDELDVIGINYNLDKYDKIHEKYPDKAIFSSECCATGTTRGWYQDDFYEKQYLSAYDKDTTNWFLGREKTWKFICEREWVLGEYQWTAFEHRGETLWPRLSSQSGAIDLYLQKKDAFFQNQSHWIEDKPVLHLLPHWNFKGLEGETIKVVAYTNCEEVELFLNGKPMGNKKIEKYGHGEWLVEYEAGEIKAVGKNNGEVVITDIRKTTKNAEKLYLKLENKVRANGRDVAIITCSCLDENGEEVPDAMPYVQFSTNNFGKIIGTGSDVSDSNPVYLTDRKMRAGRASVAVKVGKIKGELKVYARAEGLEHAILKMKL